MLLSGADARASREARDGGAERGDRPMNAARLMSVLLCGEFAATSLALLLALVCRIAENATTRRPRLSSDVRADRKSPDGPMPAGIRRP